LGVRIDLGRVQAKPDGDVIYREDAFVTKMPGWVHARDAAQSSRELILLENRFESNAVIRVDARSDADAALVLRYRDADNYLLALYSASKQVLQLVVRRDGKDGDPVAVTNASGLHGIVTLTAEVRGDAAIISINDGTLTATSPIVNLPHGKSAPDATNTGLVGVALLGEGSTQKYANFELRQSMEPIADADLERSLYDASGRYRGVLAGKHWGNYGKNKTILLNAYRPEKLPFVSDWVLVLDASPSELPTIQH
jgi:hypothetical protein